MNDNEVQFLPFDAINEFMVDEYRHQVLQNVFSHLDDLSGQRRAAIVGQVRKLIKVPGFRNSSLAPVPLKVRAAQDPFEHNPAFAADILAAWSELHTELRQQVFDLLGKHNWDLLPIDADRTKLPGFLNSLAERRQL